MSLFIEVLMDAYISTISSALGIDKNIFKKLIKPRKQSDKEIEILDNFDLIQRKLNESQEIVQNVLADVVEQKKIFEQKAKEAEISRNIADLNQSEVAAVNALLEKSLARESKKSNIQNIIWGLVFCLLSAVIGYLLGKFL